MIGTGGGLLWIESTQLNLYALTRFRLFQRKITLK
jgi:hypothetical protein